MTEPDKMGIEESIFFIELDAKFCKVIQLSINKLESC